MAFLFLLSTSLIKSKSVNEVRRAQWEKALALNLCKGTYVPSILDFAKLLCRDTTSFEWTRKTLIFFTLRYLSEPVNGEKRALNSNYFTGSSIENNPWKEFYFGVYKTCYHITFQFFK